MTERCRSARPRAARYGIVNPTGSGPASEQVRITEDTSAPAMTYQPTSRRYRTTADAASRVFITPLVTRMPASACDDVPLVAIDRTEVDDRRAAQQAHRANVRASVLGDPAGALR